MMDPDDHRDAHFDMHFYSIKTTSDLGLPGQATPAYTDEYGNEPSTSSSYNPSLFPTFSTGAAPSEEEYNVKDGDGLDIDLEEDHSHRSESTKDDAKSDDTKPSPPKRPRITLARGGACVPCRNRKLKCSGSKPCVNCDKAGLDCRHEEIRRRKPRHVLLEERIDELEALLISRGETVPPSQLRGVSTSSSLTDPLIQTSPAYATSEPLASSFPTGRTGLLSSTAGTLPSSIPLATMGTVDIPPQSALEIGLITFVLPYTPHLSVPLHPERFVSLLYLPAGDPRRPHPALLYILFAQAARLLQQGTAPPLLPPLPLSLFPTRALPSIPAGTVDPTHLLQYIGNSSLAFLERARSELDKGIRAADRPFDLARAAVGIAHYLYSVGHFFEAWTLPVTQLHAMCGTHRVLPSIKYPTTGQVPFTNALHDLSPLSSSLSQTSSGTSMMINPGFPAILSTPSGHTPLGSELDTAERVSAFWAAKAQQWTVSIARGLTSLLPDDDCTTPWPSGSGSVELGASTPGQFSLADLFDPCSDMQGLPYPETTFVLALKSLGLLHRAVRLFNQPLSKDLDAHHQPITFAPLVTVQSVERVTQMFRLRLPSPFHDLPTANHLPATEPIEPKYDGFNDPWWITLHANLYTTELLVYKEMANHRQEAYDMAVSCARALVGLVQRVKPDQWVHVDMTVAHTISFVARFLNQESRRLIAIGRVAGAKMAADEAEILRLVLERDIAKQLPMARMLSVSVQLAKEGTGEGMRG